MAPVDMPTLFFAFNTFFKYGQLIKFRYRDTSILISTLYAYILYVRSIAKDTYICRCTKGK